MIQKHELSAGEVVARIVSVVLGWLASIQLADVQVAVSIISGLLVAAYTALNGYVLWRDKVRRKQGELNEQ